MPSADHQRKPLPARSTQGTYPRWRTPCRTGHTARGPLPGSSGPPSTRYQASGRSAARKASGGPAPRFTGALSALSVGGDPSVHRDRGTLFFRQGRAGAGAAVLAVTQVGAGVLVVGPELVDQSEGYGCGVNHSLFSAWVQPTCRMEVPFSPQTCSSEGLLVHDLSALEAMSL